MDEAARITLLEALRAARKPAQRICRSGPSLLVPPPMRILVSNDDGIDSPGLHALVDALQALGEVWTVAPMTEQSAKSHALTTREPLRVRQLGERSFAVSGTPADCVYLAIHELCPPDISVVVSGINRGANLADDTWYSGTVGAAREGAMCGLPAIAVSLDVEPGSKATPHWAEAARRAVVLARELMADPPSERTVFNLNVPDLPESMLRPRVTCPLGKRHWTPSVHLQDDPRGRRLYWVGGERTTSPDHVGTDLDYINKGHPTLTPLHVEGTDRALLERWQAKG